MEKVRISTRKTSDSGDSGTTYVSLDMSDGYNHDASHDIGGISHDSGGDSSSHSSHSCGGGCSGH